MTVIVWAFIVCGVICIFASNVSSANATVLAPYGEVTRFGGLDKSAIYGSASTIGLGNVGSPASFVYPIGMAVDSEAIGAPDEYAIYVLENINPQALNEKYQGVTCVNTSLCTESLSLEYRIQEVDDAGAVLASKSFTLKSSAQEPNLHAVAIAVDTHNSEIYVLISDAPSEKNKKSFSSAEKIDAWTASLAPVDSLPTDPDTGAGELVGPDATHSLQVPSGVVGDINGESIAVEGNGGADIALIGSKYSSENFGAEKPIIDLFKTEGGNAGEPDGEWAAASETEDPAAVESEQKSRYVYAASANPDGSLNVVLGGRTGVREAADEEPNMATVESGLAGATALLPWQQVAEFASPHNTSGVNNDGAATDAFTQYIESASNDFLPSGATRAAGTLAPSVVQLTSSSLNVASGLYAGVVAVSKAADPQDPTPGADHSWAFAASSDENGLEDIVRPADLGIRVFDAAGESLGMIGDVSGGGVCNLESSPEEGDGSFVALGAGRDGVLFALVQPNLENTSVSEAAAGEVIAPAASVGGDMGDEIVEFAPKGSTGMGGKLSDWRECPQPSGSFSITDTSRSAPTPSTGTASVTVPVNSKLEFDANEVDTRGGSVWAYDWDLEDGAVGGEASHPWTLNDEFTATPGQGHAFEWPEPTVEHTYTKPGSYKVKLNLLSDFGVLIDEREVNVVAAEPITGVKITPSTETKAGSVEALVASATLPQFDSILDYKWNFGDSAPEEDTTGPEAQHIYSTAGEYHVKVTVTDALGQQASAEEVVHIGAAPTGGGGTTTPTTSTTPTPITPTVTTSTTPVGKPPVSKPLTNAQKLAKALKQCKKIKAKKKRVSCETVAKRKYAPPKKKTTKKKKGH